MPNQEWEYAVLDTDITPSGPDQHPYTALNAYGRDGFELVAAIAREPNNPASNRFIFFFKQPKRTTTTPQSVANQT